MRKALRYFWKEQPVALSVFLLAFALILFFGIRFVLGFLYWHDPAHRNQALEPWMTPRYVGMSYKLPPEVIQTVMQLDQFDGRRVKLDEVVDRMGISLDELEARIRAAKSEFNALKPRKNEQKSGNPSRDDHGQNSKKGKE